jgi:glycosyltransferase involved in cell wall biosynthesis
MARIPVSVIVLTHNEEENIASCLDSLSGFDEIVVVDSGSTDRTLDVLREQFPGVRVLHNRFSDFGEQRNWALDNSGVRNEWILFMDADERSTGPFADAIAATVAEPHGCDGYFVCYRNMFLGKWIRRSTMYPSWQLRLLRSGRVRYRKEGHGQREVMEGLAGYIRVPYDHYGFSKGIADWVARHNVYSTNEVELVRRLVIEPLRPLELLTVDPVKRRRAQKRLAARLPFRPLWRFLHTYIVCGGFLDGRPGFIFCLLRTAHEIHIVAKLSECATEDSQPSAVTSTPRRSVPATKNAS